MATPAIQPLSWQKTAIKHKFPSTRSNLCALSQLYNLYFIAVGSEVQVYRPTHPDQSLLPVTTLIPPKVGNFPGYIDRFDPHCINYLIVALLGNREILLLCCDDGDVCSWYTDQIHHNIEAGHQASQPPPWMTECVRISAWGLSVHTEARKIAVTSNSHNVYIYEFGLTGPEPETGGHASLTVERYRSRRLCLPDSGHNLPSVSFCNTGDDPKGQILLSGDINGRTMIWNLDTMTLQEWLTAHYCHSFDQKSTCNCFMAIDRWPHAVWGLYWLDPRSFPRRDTVVENKDANKHVTLKLDDSLTESSKSWRIAQAPITEPVLYSEPSELTPVNSTPEAPPMLMNVFASTNDSDSDSDTDSESDSDGDVHNFESEDTDDDDESLGPDTSDLDESVDSGLMAAAESEVMAAITSGGTMDESDNSDDDYHSEVSEQSGIREMLFSAVAAGYFPNMPWDISQGPQGEGDFIVSRACPDHVNEATSRFTPPSVPFLQISSGLIFLDPEHCDRKTTSASTVSMSYPLKQHIPQWEYHGNYFDMAYMESRRSNDRIVFHNVIQELGIVIVGAPIGRCAVLSLHYDTTLQHQKRYGMKLECLLPFERQELERQRPAALLMGLAVAPMQGFEKSRTKIGKTWRLILHYNDNSVLSYSIKRGDPGLSAQLEIV